MYPLIQEYLGLAQSLAQQQYRKAPHALELDEMLGIANFGLVDAASRWHGYCERNQFDPERVEFFRPFVVRRVKGALIDAIRSADWATRSLRTRAKALQDAGLGKGGLTDTELAERSGMTVTEVRSTLRGMSMRPVSMEAEELEPVTSTDVESSAFTSTVLSGVVAAISRLLPEHQVVLTLHYHEGLQLQQVAKAMGINETRASQLHAEAVLAVHAVMVRAAEQSAEQERDDPDAV